MFFFFFQAEDGIRDHCVTGVQTCALPISINSSAYFIHKEAGEAQALNFNNLGSVALKEVRESGRFVELPMARALPDGGIARSEERRVGKEGRSRGSPDH